MLLILLNSRKSRHRAIKYSSHVHQINPRIILVNLHLTVSNTSTSFLRTNQPCAPGSTPRRSTSQNELSWNRLSPIFLLKGKISFPLSPTSGISGPLSLHWVEVVMKDIHTPAYTQARGNLNFQMVKTFFVPIKGTPSQIIFTIPAFTPAKNDTLL